MNTRIGDISGKRYEKQRDDMFRNHSKINKTAPTALSYNAKKTEF